MTETIAALILAGIILALVVLSNSEHAAQYPLVEAAAPSCPKLMNPCDLVNCRRPETKRIA